MTADLYKRMERHVWYNKIAGWARILAILLMADEVYAAVVYHFPLWDDIAMPVTLAIHQVAAFVQRHTEMYRI